MEISWYMCKGLKAEYIQYAPACGAKLMDVIIRAEIVEVREAEVFKT